MAILMKGGDIVGNQIKLDFERVFLTEQGQELKISRGGEVIVSELGLVEDNEIQFKAEADIRVGDTVIAELENTSYKVLRVTYEVNGGVRICLNAQVVEV